MQNKCTFAYKCAKIVSLQTQRFRKKINTVRHYSITPQFPVSFVDFAAQFQKPRNGKNFRNSEMTVMKVLNKRKNGIQFLKNKKTQKFRS